MHLTWTPKGAEPSILGVILRNREALTREAYLNRLGGRLAKTIREADPQDRTDLARLMMQHDLVDADPAEPLAMADALTEAETLLQAIPTTAWPVPATEMTDDPEIAEAIQATSLRDWMMGLYPAV